MPEIKQDIRGVTLVVAANDSLNKNMADYVCDGVNDHVEIQAALDALPATGGEVKLLDGTYNVEATINLDTNQTLRGCGRNTILTTSTANLVFLSAVGGAGTEKTDIVIADLQIDGGVGGVSDIGIHFIYVDYSFIQNVYSRRHASGTGFFVTGIYLENSDFNTITGNTCQGNAYYGICLYSSTNNTVTGNTCQGNSYCGIYIDTSNNNTIVGNTCQGNDNYGICISEGINNTIVGNTCQGNDNYGIYLTNSSNNNTVAGNTCQGNGCHGIYLSSSHSNTVVGNICVANSQTTDNTYDDIYVSGSDYNNIQGNTCRAGVLANKPKYGINIYNATCDKNLVANNDLYNDGFGTASFKDAGTLTQVEDNNRGIEITQIKMYRQVKNTSGAQRVAGDVVSLKSVAAGNEVTAPAAIGERQVYGMVAETIADNASGLVQVKGKTTALKATNAGGGNIAVGDFLITEVGVRARKAAANTDPIFARALEACAAADVVIDAYIISPWD